MNAERIITGLLIFGVAYGCVIVIAPFLSAIAWAAILTYVTWPILLWHRRHMGPVAAALCMTLLSSVGILVPLVLVASKGLAEAPRVVTKVTDILLPSLHLPEVPRWLARLPLMGDEITRTWVKVGQDLSHVGQSLRPYAGDIAQSVITLLVQVASGGLQLAMALFIAFFFWLSGDSLGHTIRQLIERVALHHADRMLMIVGGTVRGTVYGILGTALVQGVLTGIGLAVVHVPEPILLAVLATLMSVLPIGAPLVWVPAAIWLVAIHHPWRGIILALYGVIFISGADHIIRPIFISRGAQLPYLLTLIGVIGGVLEFGGLGIFLGPVLLAVGYTLTAEFAAGQIAGRSETPGDHEA
ncbi:transporter [Acetobacter estunensis NRIC 0472]|uniref:AI-2E family transporter n=1 Tax=Acetobacter estunensis TaxID=104097 RepID=A0A967ECU1_9PROT|nr:AI-2E family transporter [Acetobacter estunensis]NHO53631.1 AI-2E family transporter [Acetobacter estunensis]GBQ25069.1 transporter [Acetobacter estunensis NRIC 0472]